MNSSIDRSLGERDALVTAFVNQWLSKNISRRDYEPPKSEILPLVDLLEIDAAAEGFHRIDLIRAVGDLIGLIICEMSPRDPVPETRI